MIEIESTAIRAWLPAMEVLPMWATSVENGKGGHLEPQTWMADIERRASTIG